MNKKRNRLQQIGKWGMDAISCGIVVMLLGMLLAAPVAAQQTLDALLNEDGTLNLDSGYRGSIDPSGFELVSGEGEAPRFEALASVPGDEKW